MCVCISYYNDVCSVCSEYCVYVISGRRPVVLIIHIMVCYIVSGVCNCTIRVCACVNIAITIRTVEISFDVVIIYYIGWENNYELINCIITNKYRVLISLITLCYYYSVRCSVCLHIIIYNILYEYIYIIHNYIYIYINHRSLPPGAVLEFYVFHSLLL